MCCVCAAFCGPVIATGCETAESGGGGVEKRKVWKVTKLNEDVLKKRQVLILNDDRQGQGKD